MIRLLAVALVLASVQQSDPHPLEGIWKISFPWHIEVVNGVVTPTMEAGELRVEVKGDSLIAVVARMPTADSPTPRPIRLSALRAGTPAITFETRDQVTVSSPDGGERSMTAISIWTLEPSGDQLSGTLERRLEGAPTRGHGPLPLTGSRART